MVFGPFFNGFGVYGLGGYRTDSLKSLIDTGIVFDIEIVIAIVYHL